jgi:hypothetical protein
MHQVHIIIKSVNLNQEVLLDLVLIVLSKSMEIGIRLYELHLGFTVCTG